MSRDRGNRQHYSVSPRRSPGRSPRRPTRREPSAGSEHRRGGKSARENYRPPSRWLDENRNRKNPSPLREPRGKSPPIRSRPCTLRSRDKKDLYMSHSSPVGRPRRSPQPPYGRNKSHTTSSVRGGGSSHSVSSVPDKKTRPKATGGVPRRRELSKAEEDAAVGKISSIQSEGRVKEGGVRSGEDTEGLEEQKGGQQDRQEQRQPLGVHDAGWGIVDAGGHGWGDTTEKEESSRRAVLDDAVNIGDDVGESGSKEIPSSGESEGLAASSSNSVIEKSQIPSASNGGGGGGGGGGGSGADTEGFEEKKGDEQDRQKQEERFSVHDAGLGVGDAGGHGLGDTTATNIDSGQQVIGTTTKENNDTVVELDNAAGESEKMEEEILCTTESKVSRRSETLGGHIRNTPNDGRRVSGGEGGGLEDKQQDHQHEPQQEQQRSNKLSVQNMGWGFIESGGHNWEDTAVEKNVKSRQKTLFEGKDSSTKGDSSTDPPVPTKVSTNVNASLCSSKRRSCADKTKLGNDEVHLLMNSSLSSQRRSISSQRNVFDRSHSSCTDPYSLSSSSKRSPPPLRSSHRVEGTKGMSDGNSSSSSSISIGRGRGRGAVMPAWMTHNSYNDDCVIDSSSDIGKLRKRRRSRSKDRPQSPPKSSNSVEKGDIWTSSEEPKKTPLKPSPREREGGKITRWGERPTGWIASTDINKRTSNNNSEAAMDGSSEIRWSINRGDYSPPPDRRPRSKRFRTSNNIEDPFIAASFQSQPKDMNVMDGKQAATTRTSERDMITNPPNPEIISTIPTSMSTKEEKKKSSAVEGSRSTADMSLCVDNNSTKDDLKDKMAMELEKERKGLPPLWEVAISEVYIYIYDPLTITISIAVLYFDL